MPTVVKGSYRCEICRDVVELVRGCRCGHHAGADWLFQCIDGCGRVSLARGRCRECQPTADTE